MIERIRHIIRVGNDVRHRYAQSYNRFYKHFEGWFILFGEILSFIAGCASVICLVSLVVYVGFDLGETDRHKLLVILGYTQLIFTVNILYQLIIRFRYTIRQNRIVKWIVDGGVVLLMVLLLYPHSGHTSQYWLTGLLYSYRFRFGVLAAYSIVDLCYIISRIPGRRTNPSLLLATSFLVFIILGTLALMLPKCTYTGISFFDSFFLASSAVCITGLSPVDLHDTLTPLGFVVISVLIQLGSLGILTFTSFFAIFFTGRPSIYNQLLLKDVVYSKSLNSLVPTLVYVLSVTLTIEVVGAVFVYLSLPEELGLDIGQRLFLSVFHSMSSFCNAGFSPLEGGMSNPILMGSNQSIYLVTSVLIMAGAIGFPILVNLKEIIAVHAKLLWRMLRHRPADLRPIHIFDLNTKVVVATTMTVLVLGTLSFFILEYNNSLRGMSVYRKLVQSLFNSLIPRSAGFASVNPSTFLDVTLLIVMIQMVIGGSSQSMAGGIKVNTLGAIMLNLRSILSSQDGVPAFHRRIATGSIRRANAMVVISILGLTTYTVTILCLEPSLPTKSLIFETISALFTVGSSLGVTAELSDPSKIVLSTAMFFGRVGLISFIMGFVPQRRDVSTHYPTDNIIIN